MIGNFASGENEKIRMAKIKKKRSLLQISNIWMGSYWRCIARTQREKDPMLGK